ncbi:fumarylacetoacetate hydrolase family protein [Mycobacterium neglectum]|uniref:fumarylacetoacetate hydrolase family protein n=1 Tax=Mycobacterium neglectum TaxID=242737 RepID=UPI001C3F3DB6|nr:fumarylacetoacetate hydrolase family protein [Mycobacterium neglectum]
MTCVAKGRSTSVGRLHDPEVGGPCLVAVRGDVVVDITEHGPTMADLLDRRDVVEVVRSARGSREWPLEDVCIEQSGDSEAFVHLLAPIDLQVIKAAGVTFVRSLLERVVEEAAGGDPQRGRAVREEMTVLIAGRVGDLTPGTPAAERLKEALVAQGLWSQYLEVGIGPDPEIFTKAPVLSAVGHGAQVGVLERSTWSNPEPEVVLVANSGGAAVGATLGNDVNHRDLEGRSALLLAQAKDANASCAIGPFIRLFDGDFGLDHVRRLDVRLHVEGSDGFELTEVSSMAEISRDPEELLARTCGRHHQYPDGFVLFTGTMFAPVADRDRVGEGFTHHVGDRVTISCPRLGTLTNTVTTSELAPAWSTGIRALMANLSNRNLVKMTERSRT